jgi:hypothetical protein
MSDWRERRARASRSDRGDTVAFTELPAHEGHKFEPTETLYDNPVEHTAWAWCDTCKTDFWLSSVEFAEGFFD